MFISLSFFLLTFNHSCELGKRFFTKFDKLAENLNTRDDIQLAYVDCAADSEFCESNGAKGNLIGLRTDDVSGVRVILTLIKMSMFSNHSGVTVYFYPEGKDRVLFNGVKTEGGLSKFLIKNVGDSFLVRGRQTIPKYTEHCSTTKSAPNIYMIQDTCMWQLLIVCNVASVFVFDFAMNIPCQCHFSRVAFNIISYLFYLVFTGEFIGCARQIGCIDRFGR